MVKKELENIVATHIADEYGDERNLEGLIADVSAIFPLPPSLSQILRIHPSNPYDTQNKFESILTLAIR